MLRYVTSTITAAALAVTVSAFAQEAAPAQTAKEQPAPKPTLSGCVVQAKTTDGGTAYLLSKAQGGSATTYVLGGSQSDWAANVNKMVEVTGSVREPSPPAGEGDAAANPKVLRPPMVEVESVKVVAEACK
jgi:hypothetical protein